jgi:hypothetical protein
MTASTTQPASICGHNFAKARLQGTAWLSRVWLFQVPPRRNTKRRMRKIVCVSAMTGDSKTMNKVSLAMFKTKATTPP